MNYCFEHGADMDQILAEEQAITAAAQAVAARGGGTRSAESVRRSLETTLLMKQLLEMGFPPSWCSKALAANHNNVNAALTWILSNGEALAAAEEAGDEPGPQLGGRTEIENEEKKSDEDVASTGPNPLRIVSGAAEIRPDLSVEGVAGGGFASVGCRGCCVRTGKWYYEAVLRTAGCMQIGWCDTSFRGDAQGGDGVGDGPHSWAYDGWREYKWHDGHAEWGARWRPGDVVGCLIDLDGRVMGFTLNGRAEEIGMGPAFTDLRYVERTGNALNHIASTWVFGDLGSDVRLYLALYPRSCRFAGGLFPCASFNRRERLQFNFGATPLRHLPVGYRPYIEAVRDAIDELRIVRESLGLLDAPTPGATPAATPLKGTGGGEMEIEAEEGEGEEEEMKGPVSPTAASSARKGLEGEVAAYLEDCTEEEMGAESLRWQHRYFNPDSNARNGATAALARATSSGGRGARGGPWTNEQAGRGKDTGLGKGLVGKAVELSVLHARRAVLTLLATWPTAERLGVAAAPWDLWRLFGVETGKGASTSTSLTTTQGGQAAAAQTWPLVQLLKLVSIVGPATAAHLTKMSLAPLDSLSPPAYLESALLAGGAPTLYAITPALADAVADAPDHFLDPLAKCVMQQVRKARALCLLADCPRP